MGVIFGGAVGAMIGESQGEKADKNIISIFEDVSKHLVNNHYALILLTSESENAELDNFLKQSCEKMPKLFKRTWNLQENTNPN